MLVGTFDSISGPGGFFFFLVNGDWAGQGSWMTGPPGLLVRLTQG